MPELKVMAHSPPPASKSVAQLSAHVLAEVFYSKLLDEHYL